MNKLKQLQEHLLNSALNIPAEHLMVFASEGKVISHTGGENRFFKTEYTGNIIITQTTHGIDVISHIVLAWIEQNEPYQDENKIDFQADILNSDISDVHLKIKLTEIIKPIATELGTVLDMDNVPDMNQLMLGTLGGSSGN